MADKVMRCVECGQSFVWRHGEQKYFRQHRLSPPKRCPACRARRRHRPLYRTQPVPFYFGMGVTASLILAAGASFVLQTNLLISWLVAINFIAFAAFGYDKLSAKMHGNRLPELMLHLLMFIGGSIGALIGFFLFNHKTSKATFQYPFWALILFQIVWMYFVFFR